MESTYALLQLTVTKCAEFVQPTAEAESN